MTYNVVFAVASVTVFLRPPTALPYQVRTVALYRQKSCLVWRLTFDYKGNTLISIESPAFLKNYIRGTSFLQIRHFFKIRPVINKLRKTSFYGKNTQKSRGFPGTGA